MASSSSLKVVKTTKFTVWGLSSEADAAPAKALSEHSTVKQVPEAKGTPKQQEAGKRKKKKGKQSNDKKPSAPIKEERDWTPELQEDYERILSVGEECISAAELKSLILDKGRGMHNGFNLYDGFEPSGRMHIAQGVFKAMNVNKCTFEGTNSTFVFWVADWFALMNDKMGGDLDKIKTVGKYLIEVWKAAGMDLSNVEFKWASEEITNHADNYWPTMLDVARRFNITRIKKCCQIMGRLEGALTSAQILYPLMQCTDVFFLKADICQLGVDQRKVNMLAREYCDAAGIKRKPVILSHHMLYGLKAGQEKMSKSDPDSAIFMEDTAQDVERKIMAAYCPSKEEEGGSAAANDEEDAGKQSIHLTVDTLKNPCLDYIQNIIFSPPGATFTAGGTTYKDFPSVKAAFLAGPITEEQLKRGLIDELNQLLEPVRTHFGTDENAKTLLAQVRQYKKESLVPKGEKEVRRLDLVKLGKAPAGSHVVFAPLPSAAPTLQEAVDVLAQLELTGQADQPLVLFLSDWTARVCNCGNADAKVIAAYYTVLLTGLNAIDPELMAQVKVVYQSEAILCDPSNYWISVINVGRHFMLNDVMGSELKDADGVGKVIGRLMQVADVMGLEPSSITLSLKSVDSATESSLIDRYYEEKLAGAMTAPKLLQVDGLFLALQPERESEAHKTENDEYFLLDDPKVHGKSKMKKAFCQAGNNSFCPPIALASCFGLERGAKQIVVNRSPENGGNVTYTNRGVLELDFASEALHPGDLKAASSVIMVETLDKISKAVKESSDATKASKALKAFQKKKQKGKK